MYLRHLLAAAVVIACLGGCTSTTTILLFDVDLNDYVGEPGFGIIYRGTEDYHHYLDIAHDGRRERYRISSFQLHVEESFPLGRKEVPVHWLTLETGYHEFYQATRNHRWVLKPVPGEEIYALHLVPETSE